VRGLLCGGARVLAFGGKDSEVTGRNIPGIRGGVHPDRELGSAADPYSVLLNGSELRVGHLVNINLDVLEAGQMSGEHSAQRAATDDTNLHPVPFLAGSIRGRSVSLRSKV
jgi:hypothetical protein